MVRRWCGRRSRGAELLEKGAAPPEGAGGGVRGARTHKSGALPADAGASRRGPPRRTGGHRGGRRPLGSATPARRVHASIGAGSPPSHRGWAAGGPYGVRRGRMPRPARVTPDSGRHAEHVHAADRRRSPVLSRGWHQFGRNTLHPSGRAGRPRTGVDRGGGSADMLLPGLPASRSPLPWSNRRRTASQRLRSAPGWGVRCPASPWPAGASFRGRRPCCL